MRSISNSQGPNPQRIALGTAQFGLDYGVANKTGKLHTRQAVEILRRCRLSGIDTLDTAVSYGDSERRLGEIGVSDMRLVSKLPPLPHDCSDIKLFVRSSVKGSLSRLGIGKLYGLLLHRAADLTGTKGDELFGTMQELKAEGLVKKIGVSIYEPNVLDQFAERYSLDLVQAPFNVFDQRLYRSGWLRQLADSNVEVHTRSAFLQGLLLMAKTARPSRFSRWSSHFELWDKYLHDNHLAPVRGALGFVLAHPQISRVVVGVDSLEQLTAILASAGAVQSSPPLDIACDDLTLIDPSTWSSN